MFDLTYVFVIWFFTRERESGVIINVLVDRFEVFARKFAGVNGMHEVAGFAVFAGGRVIQEVGAVPLGKPFREYDTFPGCI